MSGAETDPFTQLRGQVARLAGESDHLSDRVDQIDEDLKAERSKREHFAEIEALRHQYLADAIARIEKTLTGHVDQEDRERGQMIASLRAQFWTSISIGASIILALAVLLWHTGVLGK